MPSKYDEVIEALDWALGYVPPDILKKAYTHLQELKETQNLNDFMEEQE
jgi:hypothetical protein